MLKEKESNVNSDPVIAIVGVTGAVGAEFSATMDRRGFRVGKLKALASARSAGKTVSFRGKPVVIEELDERSFDGVDIALFSAGGGVSRKFAPIAVKAGAVVIDNSSAFRMDPNVPLVIPEINAGYDQAATAYMRQHRNVTITSKVEDDSTYGSILETGFAGGTAPDIIQMKSAQRLTFANNLLDLRSALNEPNPYDKRAPRWIDNFVKGEAGFPPEKTGEVANALLFIPHDENPEVYTGFVYMFNVDLVQKAGLNPNAPPTTWKDMFTWLDALAKVPDIAPIAGSSDVGGKVSQIGYAFGAGYADKFFSADIADPEFAGDLWYDKLYVLTCYEKGATMPLDNAPYYPAMMKLMRQHISYYQPGWYENSPETETLTFASGKAALMRMAFWDFDTIANTVTADKFPKGYGLFPAPYFGADTLAYAVSKGWITQAEADAAQPYAVTKPAAGGGSGMHEYGFSVNRKVSENPEKLAVVIDFLRYLTSKTAQDTYVETAKSLSSVKDVKLIDMMKQFVVPEPAGGYANYVVGYTVVEWGKSGWDVDLIKFLKGEAEWQATITAVSAAEWKGDIPPLSALREAVSAAQKDVEGATDADKAAKERALKFAQLREKLYRDYYWQKTGDLKPVL